ncbi:polysaccharide deacetylase family protein [Pseudonocardia sp.]|uniref:polysaccharide deacetylase family protein n=1 Tax=Pseudonocardia sp. TaxID=60912 RepID=UPI003D0BBE91
MLRTAPHRFDRRSLPGIYLAAAMLGVLGFFLPSAAPPATPVIAPTPIAPVTATVLTEVAGVAPGDRVVALTFDDGPDPRYTPRVLELLRQHGAIATFCVVGRQVTAHPDLVRAVAAAGMRLCDHTRAHDEELRTRAPAQISEDVLGTRNAMWAVADVHVPYFRAPAGNWSPEVARIAADGGMQPLGWTIDPRDWRRPGAAAIVTEVQQKMRPGAVILLHDGGGNRDQTMAALEQLLPWLGQQGYRFVFPTP